MKRTVSLLLVLGIVLPATVARGDEAQMSLEDCLQRALTASLEIREGRFGPPIAETGVQEAKSEFDDLLSFQTSGGYSVTPATSFFSGAPEVRQQTFDTTAEVSRKTPLGTIYSLGFRTNDLQTNSQYYSFRPQWSNTLSFTVTQPLLRGAFRDANLANTRIAESDLKAAGQDFRAVVENTLASVEQAYWQLVFLRGQAELRRQSLKTAEELQRVSQKRLDAGAGTRTELVQAKAGVAQRQEELISAEAAVRDGEDLLRSYVFPFAKEPDKKIEIVPTDDPAKPAGKVDLDVSARIRQAFGARPDVLALEARLASAGIRVSLAENQLLPRLDFFGSVDLLGIDDGFTEALQPLPGAEFPAWQIGFTVEIPFGNRAAKARHRRAVLERSRTAAGFDSLKNRVVVEVRAAVRQVETTRKQISATHQATQAAQAQFAAEQDRVAADKSTNYELLQVEDDLSQAKTRELAAIVGYRAALVSLEKATGTYAESRGLVVRDEEPAASGAEPR